MYINNHNDIDDDVRTQIVFLYRPNDGKDDDYMVDEGCDE